jgi:hypothetical protein
MLQLRLTDMTLLNCSLEQRWRGDAAEIPDDERTTYDPEIGYPDEQLIQLRINSLLEESEATAFIEGKLDDQRLPFRLSFEMGFQYSVPESEALPPVAEIEPTLVWIAFPYMRELIADITGRTPAGQYFLPPLTRLPQPDQPDDAG